MAEWQFQDIRPSRKGECQMSVQNTQPADKANPYYVILSIDGGGIRGLIPATVLVQLEKLIQAKRGDKGKIGDY